MEEWLWIVLVIAFVVYSLSPTAQKNKKIQNSLKKSKSYKKSEQVIRDNGIFAFVSFIVLIVLGFVFIFSEAFILGLIFILASFVVPFIILFSEDANKERKKLQKMFNEQEKEDLYQEELIKERARLKARKEFGREKK